MTTTTNYGWTKPTVNGDADTWGTELNTTLDGVDTSLKAVSVAANAAVPSGGALGTPTSGTLTNCTGLPIGTGVSGLGTNVASSLAIAIGSAGGNVLNGGVLGTPSSGTLTNCTGLPVSTGISGLGTSVATALAVSVGSAGAPVVNGGALGTPSSGTLTNCTGLPNASVVGLGSMGLRAVTIQSGGSASGGSNGDVFLIY